MQSSNIVPTQNRTPYLYYNANFVPAAFGLKNSGVICWFNSTLQFLLGIPSFNELLLACKKDLENNKLATAYIELLNDALHNSNKTGFIGRNAEILAEYRKMLRVNHSTIQTGNKQECADESITFIIELLGCKRIEQLFTLSYEKISKCGRCGNIQTSPRDFNTKIIVYDNAHLNTPADFQQYLKYNPSVLTDYTCENCKITSPTSNEVRILKMLNEVIIIIFSKYTRKFNTSFPDTLEFNSTDGNKLTYDLIGKIEHFGNASGGHYVAHSKRKGKWYLLDDNTVTDGDWHPSTNTYMLAYHLVKV